MGDSLREQLIALGLARSGRDSGKKPAQRKERKPKPPRDLSLDEAYRLREQAEKRSAKERKQRKIEEDRRRREINAKIQAVVDEHALNAADAEIKRNFLYKGRIRSVLVTPEQLQALNAGALGVVFLRGSYHLLSPEQVERVRGISAEHVPDLGTGDPDAEEEFPVPDDLVW